MTTTRTMTAAATEIRRHRTAARAAHKAALILFSFSRNAEERKARAPLVDALAEQCRLAGTIPWDHSDERDC